jgi:DnaK suppressor protein
MGISRKEAIVFLRNVLVQRCNALREALAGDFSLLKELRSQIRGNVADFALDTSQDEISSQLVEIETRELTNIEDALKRIRENNYGVCENCRGVIPLTRLLALPYATRCFRCQQMSEREDPHHNDDTYRMWRHREFSDDPALRLSRDEIMIQ